MPDLSEREELIAEFQAKAKALRETKEFLAPIVGAAARAAARAWIEAARLLAQQQEGWRPIETATPKHPGWWRKDIPRPHLRKDGIPTRICLDWHTVAEQTITAAMRAVEGAGGSSKLTEAINLLSKARDCVADHVESDPDQ